MRKVFRSFERFGVRYLLVSGQASVLYGAAHVTEDVDIWIQPTAPNALRLLRALAQVRAVVYKATPALTLRNMRRGHGFHFTIPSREEGEIFLDVMPVPPRVGAFAAAERRAVRMESRWGTLPVVAVEDLVKLKKTQRLYDYEVISNLVSLRVAAEAKAGRSLLAWAARNSFRASDRADFLRRLGRPAGVAACRASILRDIGRLQTADAAYWHRIVRDLKAQHRRGALWTWGTRVADLLRLPTLGRRV